MTTNLQTFLSKTIYHWVGRNFGGQEADDPSWNIEELSKYLAKELKAKGKGVLEDNSKPYELTVLLRTTSDIEEEIANVKDYIRKVGGAVLSVNNEGEKRLSYNIQGNESAIYIYMEVDLPENKPREVSGWLNIQDNILRYLMVKADTRRR